MHSREKVWNESHFGNELGYGINGNYKKNVQM